jgi:hypothetical protein
VADLNKAVQSLVLQLAKASGNSGEEQSQQIAMTKQANAVPSSTYAQTSSKASNRILCETSSNDLSILRGVAERGQTQDPRNVAYRTLQAIGIVGGGLTGVAGLGPVLPKAGAQRMVFFGAVLLWFLLCLEVLVHIVRQHCGFRQE